MENQLTTENLIYVSAVILVLLFIMIIKPFLERKFKEFKTRKEKQARIKKRLNQSYCYKFAGDKFAIIKEKEGEKWSILSYETENMLTLLSGEKITYAPYIKEHLRILPNILFILEENGAKFLISEDGRFIELKDEVLKSAIKLAEWIDFFEGEKHKKPFESNSFNPWEASRFDIENIKYKVTNSLQQEKCRILFIYCLIQMYKSPEKHFHFLNLELKNCDELKNIAKEMEDNLISLHKPA